MSLFFVFEYFQSSLINQHDHHYTYKCYGLCLVKDFVVALTYVCTVKLMQLDQLICFKWARMIVCLPGLNRTILRRKMFCVLLDNSFIELPESNLKIWEKQELI